MTHAEHLRIHRLPAQLDLCERRIAQLEQVSPRERTRYWYARYMAAKTKLARLHRRAATIGLRDCAGIGPHHPAGAAE